LIYLLDVSPYAQLKPLKTLTVLQDELKSYKVDLLRKKSLVVANKIDLLVNDEDAGIEHNHRNSLQELRDYCTGNNLPFVEISALKEINLNIVKNKLFELL